MGDLEGAFPLRNNVEFVALRAKLLVTRDRIRETRNGAEWQQLAAALRAMGDALHEYAEENFDQIPDAE